MGVKPAILVPDPLHISAAAGGGLNGGVGGTPFKAPLAQQVDHATIGVAHPWGTAIALMQSAPLSPGTEGYK